MAKFVRCTVYMTGGDADAVVNLDAVTYIQGQKHDTGMLSVINFVGGDEISVHGEPHTIINLPLANAMDSKSTKG
jgi:hypothetical protein